MAGVANRMLRSSAASVACALAVVCAAPASASDLKLFTAMVAAKREWGLVTGLIELLHVASRREDREDVGLDPKQRQTQLQAEVRMRW